MAEAGKCDRATHLIDLISRYLRARPGTKSLAVSGGAAREWA